MEESMSEEEINKIINDKETIKKITEISKFSDIQMEICTDFYFLGRASQAKQVFSVMLNLIKDFNKTDVNPKLLIGTLEEDMSNSLTLYDEISKALVYLKMFEKELLDLGTEKMEDENETV